MRRRDPRDLLLEIALVHRQRALENSRGDRCGDLTAVTAVLAALHHHDNGVLRIVERREAGEPGGGIVLSFRRRLGGSGLSGNLHAVQPRYPASAAVFIYDFPKTFPRELDLLGREIKTQ